MARELTRVLERRTEFAPKPKSYDSDWRGPRVDRGWAEARAPSGSPRFFRTGSNRDEPKHRLGRRRVALLAVRLYAASRLGFGDAEALYACYARHPQPVYLDHPGLIGVIARLLGQGRVPSPYTAHLGTSLLATATPWVAALAARATGASWRGAALAAFTLMLVPRNQPGSLRAHPDLPLILLWYAAVGLSALGIAAKPGSARALAFALGSGFAVGLACDAKVSGILLLFGLVMAWASRPAQGHRRSVTPYAALAVALVLFCPVVLDESSEASRCCAIVWSIPSAARGSRPQRRCSRRAGSCST